jgi:hypothetical protein
VANFGGRNVSLPVISFSVEVHYLFVPTESCVVASLSFGKL